MYKKSVSFILSFLMLFTIACSNQNNSDISNADSQLYATITNNFNNYYSMDIWNFENITNEILELKTNTKITTDYILGKVDLLLEQNNTYAYFAYNSQNELPKKILSESLYEKLGDLEKSKKDYLTLVSNDFHAEKKLVGNSDFLQQTEELSVILDSLNTNITSFDSDEDESNYKNQLTQATDLLSEIMPESMTTSSEITSQTTSKDTSELTNTNENNTYTYEQLKTWYNEATKLMPDVNNGLTEMYINEDKNLIIVGILDESYRDSMEHKLKDINDKDNWYEIIISEMPTPD